MGTRDRDEHRLEEARLAIYQAFFDGSLDANAATAKLLALDIAARVEDSTGHADGFNLTEAPVYFVESHPSLQP